MNTESYSKALYELAEEEHILESIYNEFGMICTLYQENPDFVRFLDMPSIPETERHAVLDRVFRGRIHDYMLYFLKILSTKQISNYLQDIFFGYQTYYFAVKNIEVAHVVTAVEMSETLQDLLKTKLEQITGKRIVLKNQIDPSCIGGMIVTFDHMRIDGAVKTKLEKIKHKLEHASLRFAENEKGGYYESGGNQ